MDKDEPLMRAESHDSAAVVVAAPNQIGAAHTWQRKKSRKKLACSLQQGDKVLAFDVGQIHMGECLLEVDYERRPPFCVKQWNIMNLGSGKLRNTINNLCKEVICNKQYWRECDYIIIEQQDRVNTKMVALSHALQAVIVMLGCTVPTFASSAHKFSVFKTMPMMPNTIILPEMKTASAYKRKKVRKNNSIRLVTNLINAMPSTESGALLTHLNDETPRNERDDLCDAFVYASAFIYKCEPLHG